MLSIHICCFLFKITDIKHPKKFFSYTGRNSLFQTYYKNLNFKRMKPPECSICNKRFFEGGGIVYFSETPEDKKINKRLKSKDMVGHPPNAFWFCEEHITSAKKLIDLTKIEALELLRKIFNS